jgi:hypothetical protein
MGWDRGRYYSRSRKESGRVVREYVGSGRVAELAAQLDALDREQRGWEAAAERRAKTELEETESQVKALADMTDEVARAALLAAGFHQHKRGEWRRRRGRGT